MSERRNVRVLITPEADRPIQRAPLRLPFNGRLSEDELRMLKQGIFDDHGTVEDEDPPSTKGEPQS